MELRGKVIANFVDTTRQDSQGGQGACLKNKLSGFNSWSWHTNCVLIFMPYFVYIVKASDNSLYTGYTVDIEKRVAVHNNGKGSKSLKGKLPVNLVYSETFESKSDALKREAAIKKLSRIEKLKLTNKFLPRE